MHLDALFTDETADYKFPYQPTAGDILRLTFRTAADDGATVTLLPRGGDEIPLTETERRGRFAFHTVSLPVGDAPVFYRYRISDGAKTVYYNRIGVTDAPHDTFDFGFVPGDRVPDWAIGKVGYQIFVDRFCNGDPTNDVTPGEYRYAKTSVRPTDFWHRSPEPFDVGNFAGGDLAGVLAKLDYLQALGVQFVWFNPIFVSPSNHKYDVQDYDHVDPHFGVILKDSEGDDRYKVRTTSEENLAASDALFEKLVREMHRRGMRVLIDGVFNHCGSLCKWMDADGLYRDNRNTPVGAFHTEASPYRSFFRYDGSSPAGYECWWDHITLPKLDYENSPELCAEVFRIGKKWLTPPYAADGWRLDVAADLGHSEAFNHRFWQEFKKSVRAANPDALLLAEHYGVPDGYLGCGEWDSVMNYDAFMDPVSYFLTGMEKHSDRFDGEKYLDGEGFFRDITRAMARFPRPALDAAMNELSNHDHSRFLTRTNGKVGRLPTLGAEAAMEGIRPAVMKLAVLLQMTWPGSPTVYYADEAGQVGFTDPDSRRTYPWGNENRELLEFYHEAISLRGKISCLARGSIKPLAAGKGYIAYARFEKDEVAIVALNATDGELTLTLPVWQAGEPDACEMTLSLATAYRAAGEAASVIGGNLTVKIQNLCGIVYKTTQNNKKECRK